ncbi:protein mono-ADP-ribosyltransferase PARP4-like [Esox lucius]|uniref:protein mono-ADP-ribosyltransferase PARP4-like n=1 Tax=Esox lucius TaxID=8010 RepID=UPI000576F81D|nr:protein mono-ADP-ribosyltransferase PARP4-like [Esox lucius]
MPRTYSILGSGERGLLHFFQEGYWECSASLGSLIGVDLDYFANVFLKEKGIESLGVRAHADILRLVASLLVLQLMRVRGHEVGKLLLSLFRVDLDHSPPQPRNDHWEAVKRAVDWVSWADREYPCVCSRLEFGLDWESSTRQLLGIDPPRFPHILGCDSPMITSMS